MYVFYALLVPAMVPLAMRSRVAALALSAAVWWLARPLAALLSIDDIADWAFNPFAWQLMFVLGIVCRLAPVSERFHAGKAARWLTWAAVAAVLAFAAVKLFVLTQPLPGTLKQNLSVDRVINFIVIAWLAAAASLRLGQHRAACAAPACCRYRGAHGARVFCRRHARVPDRRYGDASHVSWLSRRADRAGRRCRRDRRTADSCARLARDGKGSNRARQRAGRVEDEARSRRTAVPRASRLRALAISVALAATLAGLLPGPGSRMVLAAQKEAPLSMRCAEFAGAVLPPELIALPTAGAQIESASMVGATAPGNQQGGEYCRITGASRRRSRPRPTSVST